MFKHQITIHSLTKRFYVSKYSFCQAHPFIFYQQKLFVSK